MTLQALTPAHAAQHLRWKEARGRLWGKPAPEPAPEPAIIAPVWVAAEGFPEHIETPRQVALRLVEVVALAHDLTLADLLGPRRTRDVTFVRFLAMRVVAKAFPKWSTVQCAGLFNRRHTEVIYAMGTRYFSKPSRRESYARVLARFEAAEAGE